MYIVFYKFVSLLAVFLLFFSNSFAQKLDSLQLDQLIQQAEVDDSVGYSAVTRLGGYYYMQRNPEKLRYYINKELEYAERSTERKKVIEALYHLLLFHQYYSNKDSVIQTAHQLLTYTEGDTSKVANRNRVRALLHIASNLYYRHSMVDSAYVYYQRALNVAKQANNKSQYAEVSKDLITIYREQERYQDVVDLVDSTFAQLDQMGEEEPSERALKYIRFEQAAALMKIPDTTVNRAALYARYLDLLNYEFDRGSLISPMMVISKMLGDFSDFLPLDTLLSYGEQAMKLSERSQNHETHLYLNHGNNLLRAGRLTEAELILKQSIDITKKELQRYNKLAHTYEALTRVYIKKGKTTAAEETFELYKIYQDSAAADEYQTEIEMIAANYELEQKTTENQLLKEQTDKLSAQAFYLSIIGLLLSGILLVSYYLFRKIRSQNQRLKQLNETKNKVFTILAHDLKGSVNIFNNLMQKISYLIKQNNNKRLLEMADYYEQSGKKIGQVINKILDWAIIEQNSFINHPQKISVLPLIEEVIDELNWLRQKKIISIEVQISSNTQVVFDKNAFLIINRNLLSNALKFAPLHSTIQLFYHDKTSTLEYTNEGEGFPTQTIQHIQQETPTKSRLGTNKEVGMGIGLVTCIKLIKLNKGRLNIVNLSPSGAKVQLLFLQ